MVADVTYRGASESSGPSPIIWADCPVLDIIKFPGRGMHYFDDFENFSQHISDQDVQKYESYIDTGVTIKQLGGVAATKHVIEMAGNDADNDEGVLATHGPLAEVSDTAGDDLKLWFEARFKTPAIVTDNSWGTFIGLAYDFGNAVSVAKTLCLTDNDSALGAFSFLGFHVDQANSDSLDCVYKADGQTAVVSISGAKALAVSTWYRVGFVYDPAKPAARQITWYIDGVEQTTYVTGTNIAAATFPDAEPLGLAWATKVGTGSQENKAQLDWWRVAQLK